VGIQNYRRYCPSHAHVLSSVVNAYLERLLQIIHRHGGDVIKFAGDAIIVIWEGDEARVGKSTCCVRRCVLELQQRLGTCRRYETHFPYPLWTGCGPLESESLNSVHANMQRLYHSVGGESMEDWRLGGSFQSGDVCVE
jgi:hypothetical protein